MKRKQLRCSSCAKRIRSHHPHVGLIDRESGAEISYHAHPTCQRRGMQEMASLLKRGKVYVLRYHHSAACPNEAPGFGCRGGCFDTPVAVAALVASLCAAVVAVLFITMWLDGDVIATAALAYALLPVLVLAMLAWGEAL